MREIKFRAWDKKEIYYNKYNSESTKMIYDITLSDVKIHTSLEHFEIMQYTGQKDKNGVEIYEGDIVEFYMIGSYCDDLTNAVVEFKNSSFSNCVFWNGCNVIGNIYENPELLK